MSRELWTKETINLQDLMTADDKTVDGRMSQRIRAAGDEHGSTAVRTYMTGVLTGMEVLHDLLVEDMPPDQQEELGEKFAALLEIVGERLSSDMNMGVCLSCMSGLHDREHENPDEVTH